MSDLTAYEETEGVSVLTFDDGKANVFNPDTVAALQAALDRAAGAKTHAAVLTGRPNRFSAGLDLRTLPALEPRSQEAALTGYFELMNRMLLFPKPWITAASGHALAGGCVMLLTGDGRLATDGPFKIGLNETRIGISLPTVIIALAAQMLPVRSHATVMLEGRVHSPSDALAAGIVHETVPADRLMECALRRAHQTKGVQLGSFAQTKRRLREPALIAAMQLLPDELLSFFGGAQSR